MLQFKGKSLIFNFLYVATHDVASGILGSFFYDNYSSSKVNYLCAEGATVLSLQNAGVNVSSSRVAAQ